MWNRMIMHSERAGRWIANYRYASLSLTSAVFLIGYPHLPLAYKLMAVSALFLLAKWLNGQYRRALNNSRRFRLWIAMEMIGTAIAIELSGGLESPFLWCALNPALMAAAYFSAGALWPLIGAFFLVVTAGTASSLIRATWTSIEHAISTLIPFSLMIILMAFVLQLFRVLKEDTASANERMNETMDHLKSLYQVAEAAAHIESPNMAVVFAEFAAKLTRREKSFFWVCPDRENESALSVHGQSDDAADGALQEAINENLDRLAEDGEAKILNARDQSLYLAISVTSTARFMGVLGVKIDEANRAEGGRWLAQQLGFLSDLCAVILDRHQLMLAENRSIIIEEQNRIADEMHDSVSQHLFSIVYAIHTLNHHWKETTEVQLQEQLRLIQDSAQTASQEIRSTIYGLSSRNDGSLTWAGTVRAYLERLSKLHGLQIHFEARGDERFLPINYQKALYRLISEAVGNAIRHGASSRIAVELDWEPERIRVLIVDDGKGFKVNDYFSRPKVSSLGIGNIQYLVNLLGGAMDITSSKGEGTRIAVRIPLARKAETAAEEEPLAH